MYIKEEGYKVLYTRCFEIQKSLSLRYTPNNAVAGDMGWKPTFHKQWKAVINLWSSLNNMSSDRLNRKVFVWADCISTSNKCVKNCNFNIKKTLSELNVGYFGDIVDSLSFW